MMEMFTHKKIVKNESCSNFANTGTLVTSDSVEHRELSLKKTIGGKAELNASLSLPTKRICLRECDSECYNKEPQERNSKYFGSSVSKSIEGKEAGCNDCDIKKSCRILQSHISFIENHPKYNIQAQYQVNNHVVNENLKEINSQHVMNIGDSTTAYGVNFKGNLDIHSKTIFKNKQSCTEKIIDPMYSKCNTKNTQQKITGFMIKDPLTENNSCVDVFSKEDSSICISSPPVLIKNQFSYLERTGGKESLRNQLLEPIKHPICIDAKTDNRRIQGKSVPLLMYPENYKNNSDVKSSAISLTSMINLNEEVSKKNCKMEFERNSVLESTKKAFSPDKKNSKTNVRENSKNDRREVLNQDGNCQHRKKESGLKTSLAASNQSIFLSQEVIWKNITGENLFLQYGRLYPVKTADYIFQRLEEEVEYFTGDLLRVKIYGKWHDIPRKQASYGDSGLSYAFSGNRIPAIPWNKSEVIMQLKHVVEKVCHHPFNFVLVNRYKDGLDHMGEHRDDEKDLVFNAPIASLSFGQARDFIFKHKDSRGKQCLRKMDPVKLELENGSILVMQYPTNTFWYHSLPVRKKALNARINLTFRHMAKK